MYDRSQMTSGWGICLSRSLLVIGLSILALSSAFNVPRVVSAAPELIQLETVQVMQDDTDTPEPADFTADNFTVPETEDAPIADMTDDTVPVVEVIDGDTIDVDIAGITERVRLIGIDTPETLDQRKPVQCFGREASAHTHELLDSAQVKLENDPLVGNRDKYGRLLRYVFLGDTLINEQLISEGFAHEYTYQSAYKYQVEFKNAELGAQRQLIGLWSPLTCGGNTTQPAAYLWQNLYV